MVIDIDESEPSSDTLKCPECGYIVSATQVDLCVSDIKCPRCHGPRLSEFQ